jgi:predicted amidohydrolase YtcJ
VYAKRDNLRELIAKGQVVVTHGVWIHMSINIDLLIHNANIITMNSKAPQAQAMAISNERILAIGTESEIDALREYTLKVVDCEGRTVLPGFIDTHAHLAGLGRKLLHLDLGETTSAEEAITLVAERVQSSSPGKPIIGYNWDESNWTEPCYLTKTDLDEVAPENPVILSRVCGHLISLNSAALARLTLDPENPGIDRDRETNEPTGVLRDIPIDMKQLGAVEEDLSKVLLTACRYANSVGVTSVHENLYRRQLPFVNEYLKLQQKGLLTVRVYANLERKLMDLLAGLGLRSGLGDEYFRLGGVKVFIDGSLGAQTAAISHPYKDKPDTDGLILLAEADYEFLLQTANQLGLQVSTHAIGDRAIELVLRSHEKVSTTTVVKALRHNIIHAELLTVPLIDRVKALDLLLLLQPNFVHRWGLPDGMYDARLGPELAQQLNNFRLILDAGIPCAFGSDCMPMDPFYGIFSAVTHPNPAIRITVEEALRLYTADAAYASFEEHVKGILAPGMLADFIIISANPLTIPPEELRDIEVLETYVGGKSVYSGL